MLLSGCSLFKLRGACLQFIHVNIKAPLCIFLYLKTIVSFFDFETFISRHKNYIVLLYNYTKHIDIFAEGHYLIILTNSKQGEATKKILFSHILHSLKDCKSVTGLRKRSFRPIHKKPHTQSIQQLLLLTEFKLHW